MARNGAGVVHLSIFHNDIEEFINSKKVNADEKLRLKTLSTAIIIPDKFMNLLSDNSSRYYYTFNPKNVFDVTGVELADMDMTEWYDKLVENRSIKKTQRDKLKLVQEIIRSQKESGYPYLIFIDTMNKEHKLSKIGKIEMSNLCVAPYTKILTKEYGYIEISKVENQLVNVWNGEQWSETVVKKTGENQKLVRIKTSTNNDIDCTPYHKFYIYGLKSNGDVDNTKIIEKRAIELNIDDKLIIYSLPNVYVDKYKNNKLNYAYFNGFFSADGTGNKTKIIYLYGEKINLIDKFKELNRNIINKGTQGLQINVSGLMKEKYFIPNGYNLKSKIEWLSGLFDGDGNITNYPTGHQSFDLVSINRDFLIEIHYMLQELGVDNRVIYGRRERNEVICGKFAKCKDQYRLKIGQRGINRLIDLGINTYRLKFNKFNINKLHKRLSKIISIEKLNGVYDTYCFTEPLRNMGMFNGMLLGNCTEIAQLQTRSEFDNNLYSGKNNFGYDVQCVLSSLNLVNLFTGDISDEDKKNVIISSMKFLSNVSDISNLESVPSVINANKNLHSVGLGALGLHTLFVKYGIEYESEEAKDLTNLLFSYIRFHSLYGSMEIAKERGKFKDFEKSDYANGKALEKYTNGTIKLKPQTEKVKSILNIMKIIIPNERDWYTLNEDIMKYGLYNAYQLTLAPNQSSAYIMEVSPSVAPVSSEVEFRDYGYLQTVYPMPLLTNENKYLYKSAYDVDQKKMLDLVRVMQDHIDQAISTVININSDTTMKEHLGIIIYAWKIGIKTLYYWRTRKQSIMADKEPICESCSV